MTIKRLLTGGAILPLLILLILKGSVPVFTGFIMLVALLGLIEFYRMALPECRGIGIASAFAGSLLIPTFLTTYRPLFPFLLTLLVLFFAILVLLTFKEIKAAAGEASLLFAGFLYVPLLLGHVLLLRELDLGINLIFLVMVIVMSGDTAAFYLGSSFGRRKLYPSVSPNKSIEGAIGGLAGSLAGAFIARATFFPELSPVACIALAILLGLLGQLGDLFESLLKRSFGVKDSGTIFPGHGGILDRLDSILFAVPAAFYYALYVGVR